MKSVVSRLSILAASFLLVALAPAALAQGTNGQLYSLSTSGTWDALGIAAPVDAVDIEGSSDTLIARTSAGAWLRYDSGAGSWSAWAASLPAGTVEVRFLGDFGLPDNFLVVRTVSGGLSTVRNDGGAVALPLAPPGTVRIGAGSGIYALTSGGRIDVLSDTSWIDAAALPGPASGVAYFQGTIFSCVPDGSWRRYDISQQAFVAADTPAVAGVRLVLVYAGRLVVWK